MEVPEAMGLMVETVDQAAPVSATETVDLEAMDRVEATVETAVQGRAQGAVALGAMGV
jgi:hypothetical protein